MTPTQVGTGYYKIIFGNSIKRVAKNSIDPALDNVRIANTGLHPTGNSAIAYPESIWKRCIMSRLKEAP